MKGEGKFGLLLLIERSRGGKEVFSRLDSDKKWMNWRKRKRIKIVIKKKTKRKIVTRTKMRRRRKKVRLLLASIRRDLVDSVNLLLPPRARPHKIQEGATLLSQLLLPRTRTIPRLVPSIRRRPKPGSEYGKPIRISRIHRTLIQEVRSLSSVHHSSTPLEVVHRLQSVLTLSPKTPTKLNHP
jgi:hypothetical protein